MRSFSCVRWIALLPAHTQYTCDPLFCCKRSMNGRNDATKIYSIFCAKRPIRIHRTTSLISMEIQFIRFSFLNELTWVFFSHFGILFQHNRYGPLNSTAALEHHLCQLRPETGKNPISIWLWNRIYRADVSHVTHVRIVSQAFFFWIRLCFRMR